MWLLCVCLYLCVYAHANGIAGVSGDWKKVLDPLELRLHVVVTYSAGN